MSPVGKVNEGLQWVLQHERNPDPRELTWEPMRVLDEKLVYTARIDFGPRRPTRNRMRQHVV